MWYSLIGQDKPGTLQQRLEARPAHIERLKQLQEQGRLLVAGPNPAVDSSTPGEAGFTGSVVIAEFASLAAAQSWADEDPYIDAGVYDSVTVKPFIKALP